MITPRPNIAAMRGYVPGEQPRDRKYIKLNTNENPYPPSPRVRALLQAFDPELLRLYPDPAAEAVRAAAARIFDLPGPEWVLAGNGSDDLLTIGIRTFLDPGAALAYPDPTYSLYPVLAQIQGAKTIPVPLTADFALPEKPAARARDAALFFLARPNAPTGNAFPLERVREICRTFPGLVWIDEAYADFARDNALGLTREFDNVLISRTLSKSYSLAGIRLGLAFAPPPIIREMMKVKDSYNVNRLSQEIALVALEDQDYLKQTVQRICRTRERVAGALRALGCTVAPSEANFLFVRPPIPAERFFTGLRAGGILVRYFPGARTGAWVRITIGTDSEMDALLAEAKRLFAEP